VTNWRIAFDGDGAARATRNDWIVGILAVTAFVVARLWHVFSFRVWFDEIFTLQASARDWGSLLWFVRTYDVHPPLFYMVTKLWLDLGGQSFIWLGLFPALTAIATLIPLYWLSRELRVTPREFNLMVILMAVNGYLVGYAQEFRVYNFLMMLAVTSFWLFVRYCNRPAEQRSVRAIVPLALVNLLMVYTHYYGWLFVGAEGLFLLLLRRRELVAFAAATAAAVIAYVPWAWLVYQAAAARAESGERALFFIPKPDAFSVAFFYGALNGLFDVPRTTSLGIVIFGLPVAVWMWRAFFGRAADVAADRPALVLCILLAVVPVLAAFVASRVLPTAIWGQRHLIVVAAPYYILVAVALLRVPARGARLVMTGAVVAWALAAGVVAQIVPYKTPAWDVLVDHVIANTPPGHRTRIYSVDEDAAFPMQYYLQRLGRSDIEVAVMQQDTPRNRARFFSGTTRTPYWALFVPVVLATDVRSLGTDFWVCDDREDARNLGQPGRPLAEVFAEAGYRLGEGKSAELVNRRWTKRMVSVMPVTSTRANTVVRANVP
jgi:hypothetical protein